MNEITKTRIESIIDLRQNKKLTFVEIGKIFNVSKCRASQLYHQAIRIRNSDPSVLDGLRVQAMNVLHCANFQITNNEEKEKLKNRVLSGEVDFLKYRNCGKVIATEILLWLGIIPAFTVREKRNRKLKECVKSLIEALNYYCENENDNDRLMSNKSIIYDSMQYLESIPR